MTADKDLSAPKRWNMYAATPTLAEKTKWTSLEVEEGGDWVLYADHERAVQAAVADAKLEMINSLKDEIARQEGEGGEGSSLWCVIDGERTIHEIRAQERMDARVQAAVAKAVEAERMACAMVMDMDACDLEEDALRFRGGTNPHHARMAKAETARKYAAAIRSRGVAG